MSKLTKKRFFFVQRLLVHLLIYVGLMSKGIVTIDKIIV